MKNESPLTGQLVEGYSNFTGLTFLCQNQFFNAIFVLHAVWYALLLYKNSSFSLEFTFVVVPLHMLGRKLNLTRYRCAQVRNHDFCGVGASQNHGSIALEMLLSVKNIQSFLRQSEVTKENAPSSLTFLVDPPMITLLPRISRGVTLVHFRFNLRCESR